ncbi:MAG: serine/threonine protein kinase [Vulcanimicrobiota bacterium]
MERTYQAPKRRRTPSPPFSVLFPVLAAGTTGLVYLLLFMMFLIPIIQYDLRYTLIILPLLIPASMAGLAAWGMVRDRIWAGGMLVVFTITFISTCLLSMYEWEYNIFYMIRENLTFYYPCAAVLLIASAVVYLLKKKRDDKQKRLRKSLAPKAEIPEKGLTRQKGEVLKGRYEVLEPLGRGASGAVYLVRDLTFGGSDVRWVLKEIELRGLSFEEREEAGILFDKECTLLKSLNHPAIPKLIEHFRHEDSAGLVMEYVEGKSLESLLKEEGRPLDVERTVEIAEELVSILSYLHDQNPRPLIFRDLKPSNIMITGKGRLRLIDFGIARYHSPGKQKDTLVYGTPGFSPPEQYGLGQTDERSDIYAYGATLYYLLTGEEPLQFCFNFPQLRSINSAVPGKLESLVMKCLSRDKTRRPDSAEQIIREIEKLKKGLGAFQVCDGKDIWIGFYFIAAVAVRYLSIGSSRNPIEDIWSPVLAAVAVIICAAVPLYRQYRKKLGNSAQPDMVMKVGQFFLARFSRFENRLQGIFVKGR